MKPNQCPRYQSCSAAICPLQGSVINQKMLKGERVCGVLLEYQKPESKAFLATHYGLEMMRVMAEATAQIKDGGGYLLRSALFRAEQTGTRLGLAFAN